MSYDEIEKILEYGSTYRAQELTDLIKGSAADSLADSLCAIMISVRATMPPHVFRVMKENLLRFHTNSQFQLIREEEEGENDEGTTG